MAVTLTNPQTWNRYAYVGNSPLTNIDPLGLKSCPECHFLGFGGAGGCSLDGVDTICVLVQALLGPQMPGDETSSAAVQTPAGVNSVEYDPTLDFNYVHYIGVTDAESAGLPSFLLPSYLMPVLPVGNNGPTQPPQPPKPPQAPNSPNHGAGLCAATPALQLRHYGGCSYLCEFVYDDPFDIRIGGMHATGRAVDAACGPGRFCPALLTVEKDNPGTTEPVNILSCVP